MKRRLIALLITATLLLVSLPALAQLEALRFEPSRVPVGQVFHFAKSQLDGSHATRVSVYLPAGDRVESLKWDEDGSEATLVMAWLDWERFSVRRFEAFHLARGAEPERRATLEVTGDRLSFSLFPEPIELRHWPWHSYDFDYTSLGLTLPHLVDPEGSRRLAT